MEYRSKSNNKSNSQHHTLPPGYNCLTRRDAIKAVMASAGTAAFFSDARADTTKRKPDPRKGSPKRYDMKKSINQWAFPYPERMNLKECLQLAKDAGFDGIKKIQQVRINRLNITGAMITKQVADLSQGIGAISAVFVIANLQVFTGVDVIKG